jgi:hypothetical protein
LTPRKNSSKKLQKLRWSNFGWEAPVRTYKAAAV